MGKMKTVATKIAEENYGSFEEQAIANNLDDEYWEEYHKKEKAYIKGEYVLDLTKVIDSQINNKYKTEHASTGNQIEV